MKTTLPESFVTQVSEKLSLSVRGGTIRIITLPHYGKEKFLFSEFSHVLTLSYTATEDTLQKKAPATGRKNTQKRGAPAAHHDPTAGRRKH